MTELLSGGLFPVLLTVAAYQLGLLCQRRWRSPLFNPILIAVLLVIAVLSVTGVTAAHYQTGTAALSWLITPATVSLAIPLYNQLNALRRSLPAVLAGVAAGTVTSLVTVLAFARMFRFTQPLTMSLLPKSITSAMGVALSELGGGVPAVTTAAIILTGILGSLMGPLFCRLFRLTDPVAKGVAFGTASHVIGTARATELGELMGAAGSLALLLAGILTAILFPLMTPLIG